MKMSMEWVRSSSGHTESMEQNVDLSVEQVWAHSMEQKLDLSMEQVWTQSRKQKMDLSVEQGWSSSGHTHSMDRV